MVSGNSEMLPGGPRDPARCASGFSPGDGKDEPRAAEKQELFTSLLSMCIWSYGCLESLKR